MQIARFRSFAGPGAGTRHEHIAGRRGGHTTVQRLGCGGIGRVSVLLLDEHDRLAPWVRLRPKPLAEDVSFYAPEIVEDGVRLEGE
jgi:hypothetical protein